MDVGAVEQGASAPRAVVFYLEPLVVLIMTQFVFAVYSRLQPSHSEAGPGQEARRPRDSQRSLFTASKILGRTFLTRTYMTTASLNKSSTSKWKIIGMEGDKTGMDGYHHGNIYPSLSCHLPFCTIPIFPLFKSIYLVMT